MYGKIKKIKCNVIRHKLYVKAIVVSETNKKIVAFLPSREMATIFPRSVLLGDNETAKSVIIETLNTIAKRMAEGRIVNIHSFQGKNYITFLKWERIRFI